MREGALLRTYRDGKAKLPGYLDDYACFTQGLIELHRATGEARWLEQADRFAAVLVRDFEDTQDGGFFFTASYHEDLLMRSKSLGGGGNMPDANGIAAQVLLDLAGLTGRAEYRESAERALNQAYASHLSVKPGESLRVAVAIDIDEGWHLYGENPEAEFLIPTTVEIEPAGPLVVGNIQKPEAHRAMDPFVNQMLNTYTERVWFHVPVTVSADAAPGAITLTLSVITQACDARRCLHPQTTTLRIPVQVDPDASSEKRHTAVFASSGASSRSAHTPDTSTLRKPTDEAFTLPSITSSDNHPFVRHPRGAGRRSERGLRAVISRSRERCGHRVE